jgi:ATP-dependent RNA helicase RhlE
MPPEIEKLTRSLLNDPVNVAVTPVSSSAEHVEQTVYFVSRSNKAKLLTHLLKNPDIYSALVFTRTKHGANLLAATLSAAGEACDVIHANKSQSARQLALSRFKSGKTRVLVATDIVARGIDITDLSHVINFDMPEAPEDYVHRIGRTGRAGLSGTAISFCDNAERKYLEGIQKLIGKKVPVVEEHPYPQTVSFDSFLPTEPTKAPSGRRGGYSAQPRRNARYSNPRARNSSNPNKGWRHIDMN